MTKFPSVAAAMIVLSIALSGCSEQTQDTTDVPKRPTEEAIGGLVNNTISIDFSESDYTFTLSEAAKGVSIGYTITVKHDLDGVIPRPQDAGQASGAGPSGLIPFEKIFGNGESYSLQDIGLGQPNGEARTIKKGVYPASFKWDGRNWNGPSDFGNPKGDPFPPGSYTLTVRVVGELETADGKKPYDVSNSVVVNLAR